MSAPFFSIVIPTRNRAQLFKESLQSALEQDFDDFEVIASDNLSVDETSAVIEVFRNNPRFSVFRPDNSLSMPEHWEFATLKARGRYILLLTDRSVLKRHALRTIHDAIRSSDQDILVCSWRWSLFDDSLSLEFSDHPILRSGGIFNYKSREVAQRFAAGREGFPYELPRALNSCYRSDLVDEIRSKHGALFVPFSQDFTAAFLLLAYAETLLFLDTALFISQGLGVSLGGSSYSSISVTDDYMNSLGVSDYYAHVPIKIPLVENLIYEDFLAIQEKAGGNLQGITLDWSNYFLTCYRELIKKNAISRGASEEQVELLHEWERALIGFDGATQLEVARKLTRLKWEKIKAFIKNTSLGPLMVRVKRRFDARWQTKRTILNLAGFSDVERDK